RRITPAGTPAAAEDRHCAAPPPVGTVGPGALGGPSVRPRQQADRGVHPGHREGADAPQDRPGRRWSAARSGSSRTGGSDAASRRQSVARGSASGLWYPPPVEPGAGRAEAVRPWVAAALLAGATFAVYANAFGNAFVWDDLPLIVDNPRIKSW